MRRLWAKVLVIGVYTSLYTLLPFDFVAYNGFKSNILNTMYSF